MDSVLVASDGFFMMASSYRLIKSCKVWRKLVEELGVELGALMSCRKGCGWFLNNAQCIAVHLCEISTHRLCGVE